MTADPDRLGPHIPTAHLAATYDHVIRHLPEQHIGAYAQIVRISLERPDTHAEAVACILYMADQIRPEDSQLFDGLVFTAIAMANDWGGERLARDFAADLDQLPTADTDAG